MSFIAPSKDMKISFGLFEENHLVVKYIVLSCMAILLISVAYFNASSLGFATVDDKWMLLKNTLVNDDPINISKIKEIFTSFNSIQYSPLNTLYYLLIYKVFGFDAYYFHLFSLLIHICNGWLVYKVVDLLLQIFKIDNSKFIAYITVLIWLILPINVEAVIWISASKIMLFSFFTLSSTFLFIKYLIAGRPLNLFLSLLLYICSFLCKEQAIVTPLMLFAIYFIHSTGNKINRHMILIFFIIISLATLLFIYITLLANQYTSDEVMTYSLGKRIVLSIYCLFFYLFNTFLPIKLHYHYPYPFKPDDEIRLLFYLLPILFAIITWCLFKYINRLVENKFYLLMIIVILLQMFLCLQVIPIKRPAVMADRYMYLPSIFMILTITINVFNYIDGLKGPRKIIAILACCAYLATLTLYSNILVINWQKMMI